MSEVWTAPDLSSLPSWEGCPRVAVDVETKDPFLGRGKNNLGPGVRRDGAHLAGISFALEGGPAHYLPINHLGGGNLPEEKVLEYLRDQSKFFTGEIGGAYLPYDLDWLAEEGIVFRKAKAFRDVQVAAPLINDLFLHYSLDKVAERLDLPMKDERLLRQAAEGYGLDPKKDLWQLPAKYVGAYAEQDARLPLQILHLQDQEIEKQGIQGIYDLESKVLPILVKMRRRGVAIDFDQVAVCETRSLTEEKKALDAIYWKTNIRVDVGDTMKAERCAEVMRALGIEPPITPKTQKPSIKSDWLRTIDHDVAGLLVEARAWAKLRTTFCASIKKHAINGRVHCTFNQLRRTKDDGDDAGALYGRLSSADPNLQQQPSRHPIIAPLWRSIYIPEPGGEWACLDYSQQEPRWTTHFAEATGCDKAREAADKYRSDPDTDNHQMMADMAGIKRKEAKEFYLGLTYGMGGGKMAIKLGLPTMMKDNPHTGGQYIAAGEEGQALLDRFNENAPYLKQLSYKAQDRAKLRGYVRTILGRRCRFERNAKGGYDFVYKALNRLIQGSSADQMKKAMVDADDAGFWLQLQVHDELDLTIQSREEAVELSRIMVEAVPCRVPHRVDIEVGPSWGEIKEIECKVVA